MNSHCQSIINEYLTNKPVFETILAVMDKILRQLTHDNNIQCSAIEGRVKTQKSLEGKLDRKGDKYNSLKDITDITGMRVITVYNDSVDVIGNLLDSILIVDKENSVDKRKLLDPDRFRYVSLHAVCQIPKELYYDPVMPMVNEYKFEIQICSSLQHMWAEIEHDVGYKSEIEIPKPFIRRLHGLAGLLEIADGEFTRIRDDIVNYKQEVYEKIAAKDFSDLAIDSVTFKAYLDCDPFATLNERISKECNVEITSTDLMPYLRILKGIGINSIHDIEIMIEKSTDKAIQLTKKSISDLEIDIISSSIAVRNLCIAEVVRLGGNEKDLIHLFQLLSLYNNREKEQAALILNLLS